MAIYPIAQVSEPFSAIQFLAERVAVEKHYGLEAPDQDQLPDMVEKYSEDEAELFSDDSDSTQHTTSGRRHKAIKPKRVKKPTHHAPKGLNEYRWSAYDICEAMALKRGFVFSLLVCVCVHVCVCACACACVSECFF